MNKIEDLLPENAKNFLLTDELPADVRARWEPIIPEGVTCGCWMQSSEANRLCTVPARLQLGVVSLVPKSCWQLKQR